MNIMEELKVFQISQEDEDRITNANYNFFMESVFSNNLPDILTNIFNNKTQFGLYISKGILEYNHNIYLPEKRVDEEFDDLTTKLIHENSKKSIYAGNTPLIIIGTPDVGLEISVFNKETGEFEFKNYIEREKNKVIKLRFPTGQYTSNGFEERLSFEAKELSNFIFNFNIGYRNDPEQLLKLYFYPDSKAYIVRR